MPRLAGRKLLILMAAADLLARNGYDATSLMEIAKAANSNTGSLMYFFRSKAHLALAVRDSVVTGLATVVGAALDKHPRDIAKAVESAITAYLAWAAGSAEQVALLRELANVRLAGKRTDGELLAQLSDVLDQWAAPLCKVGMLPKLEPGHLFAVILGPAVTFCSTSSPERLSDLATPVLAHVLASRVIGGLCAPLDGAQQELKAVAHRTVTAGRATQGRLDLGLQTSVRGVQMV